ncbi:MAG: DUF4235 domain-containing protein [Marmoricola sp.]
MPGPRVAVFDLDATLLTGDAFTVFARQLIGRDWWRTVLALGAAPVLVPLFVVPRTRRYGASGLLWVGTVGLAEPRFVELSDEFARHRVAGNVPRQDGSALASLQMHLVFGDTVVVATECIEPLATQICAAMAPPEVRVVATSLARRGGGYVVDRWCRGRSRAEMVSASGVAASYNFAYTDTGNRSRSITRRSPMKQQQQTSKSAKILYRPIGIAGSLAGGLLAKQIFEKAWQRAAPGDQPDPPKALETEYPIKQILLAAAIQGAIFALVKTIINRGGARAFERATGEWPGG